VIARPAQTFRALRHRNFRLFFFGQGVSNVGTWLQQVAMGWLVYRLTGSALLLGVIAFCSNAGVLLFGTFAGVIADRVDRRRAILVTQSLLALQAVVLAAITAAGVVQPSHLVVLALWLGTVNAFDLPVRQSLYVHLVDDRDDLPNAIALNSFLVNVARVVGPALAGLLLAVTSEAVCFALNALSFIAVLTALARIRFPRDRDRPPEGGLRRSWIEGFRYVTGFAPARAVLALVAALAWTVTPYASLMPIYAKDVYAGGPPVLGMLLSAAGVGALLSTVYLASRSTVEELAAVIARATAVAGAALAAFAYLRVLPLALALMFAVGAALILAAASCNTILQTIVEDRLRGRVAGFYTLAYFGVMPLGNLAAGAIAARIGAPATFLLNGALALAAALLFARKRASLAPAIRTAEAKSGARAADRPSPR
jgi:MFS family permease